MSVTVRQNKGRDQVTDFGICNNDDGEDDELGSKYSEYFITCLYEVLSESSAHPNFPSLRIIRFLRYVAVSVDCIIEMVKARMVAAKISPEKLAPSESVAFEDCEPLKVGKLRDIIVLKHCVCLFICTYEYVLARFSLEIWTNYPSIRV